MSTEKPVKDHVLKLTGKVSVLEPLGISNKFHVEIDGAVTSVTDSDNEDGTINRTYKFEPVVVVALKDTGERILAKDPRSWSQKVRMSIYRHWEATPKIDISHDEYYDRFQAWFVPRLGQFVDMFEKYRKEKES